MSEYHDHAAVNDPIYDLAQKTADRVREAALAAQQAATDYTTYSDKASAAQSEYKTSIATLHGFGIDTSQLTELGIAIVPALLSPPTASATRAKKPRAAKKETQNNG